MNPRDRHHPTTTTTRRSFLQAAGAAASLAAASRPFSIHASNKSGSDNVVVGEGAHKYEAQHGWGQLPDSLAWGNTHGVCIDRAGQVYVKHQSSADEPIDAIVVFDPDGKFVRSFGKEYHGGGHGIDVRLEDGEEFLYLSDIKNRQVVKTSLSGEVVWQRDYPREPDVYRDEGGYRPTNVAFRPDGGFYVGDGYGSHFIHQYDAQAKWIRTFGGVGEGEGQLRTPHGLWLDDRPGRDPSLVVADRANARLQYFDLDGNHLGLVSDVSFPADIDIRGKVMLVPDLHARVTLFDDKNQVITHLGYDAAWTEEVLADGFRMRGEPDRWQAGRFIHPHDACFDGDGNIYVVEWVPTGRVSRLRHVS